MPGIGDALEGGIEHESQHGHHDDANLEQDDLAEQQMGCRGNHLAAVLQQTRRRLAPYQGYPLRRAGRVTVRFHGIAAHGFLPSARRCLPLDPATPPSLRTRHR